MVKSDPFKERPKAPNRGQIVADLESAPSGDVVFKKLVKGTPSSRRSKVEESSTKHLPQGSTSEQDQPSGADKTVIENHYQQVTKLIDLQTQLINEPKLLQAKYEQLEKLGEDVSQSITELKSAAESVVKKS